MKANINLSESSESGLKLIETISNINGLKANNKEKQIELAIKIAVNCIKSLDAESLESVCNLKKSI
jgi:hypothetical protein